MNARSFFFNDEITLSDKLSLAIEEVTNKPRRLSLMFWFFFLQVCIALFILIGSVLLPIWLLW